MLHVAQGEEDMLTAHDSFHPDAIVAPFLTKRVPERLWRNNVTCPVLIVHPGVRGDRGVSSIDWALKSALLLYLWVALALQAVTPTSAKSARQLRYNKIEPDSR